MAGLSQDEALLAAPHLEPPGERLVTGLTVNLAVNAGQAGRIAAESGARLLVLTHFSQRYDAGDGQLLADQAAAAFGGQVALAHDLDRIPVPPRRPPSA